MLKLYYAKGTCALATHIALEEVGADFEAIRIDFASNQQQSADYLAINPKGRVPALITDQGVLTETPALLLYVAQRHPEARLAPLDDPFALARLQSVNSYLCSTMHIAHAHGRRGRRWVDDEAAIEAMRRKVPVTMADCAALVERTMLAGPWVMGDDYSVGDAYLYTLLRWLDGDGVDVAQYPKLVAHMERMSERPAVQRAVALHV